MELDNEQEFVALTRKISADRGFGCASYKERCLRRRIAVRMRARGVHTYTDYMRLLDHDEAEYDRLIDALTINVTKLFRNWDAYESLQQHVVPALWHAELPRIRVWSAGCSSGQEPYSLAMLFHRYVSTSGMLAQIGRVDILGTDIDRGSLTSAARAEFAESDFEETPDEFRSRYFSPAPPFAIAAAVHRMVRFERRDLLTDPPPTSAGPMHLIVCRNVLIYFDRDTQERLFDVFHSALSPGGFLMLGRVETLIGASRARYAPVDTRQRIFRRI